MSDPGLKLPIESSFDSRGTDAALAALRQLQAEQAKAKVPGGGAGSDPAAPFRAAGDAALQAEKDTLRYASAMAQAQRATGDTAGAVETLRNAHAQLTPNTIESFQATTRLAQAEAAAAKETQGLAAEFSSGLKSGIMSIVGPAAIAGAAIAAISKSGELIQLGAQAQQTSQRFNALAGAAHTTGDALLAALRSASAGTISDLNLELAANRAQLLGVASSAGQFSQLMAIARARAQDLGTTTQQAFDDIVTGIGRASPRILDNLGIIISEKEAYQTYATSIHKSADALTEAEKKQAIFNAVLVEGNKTIAASGGAVENNAAKIQRLGAAWDNLKASVGGGIADAVLPAADLMSTAAQATDGSRESLLRYVDAASTYTGANAQVAQINRDVAGSIAELLGMQGQQPAVASAAASAQAATTAATAQASAATQIHTQFLADDRAEAVQWQQQYIASNDTARDAAVASMADTQAKQAQTAQTQLLEAQTNAAVQAFMLLHPNISASGVASLAAAGQINPLLAQLIQATLRAREAAQALAAFNALQGLKAVNTAFYLTGGNSQRAEVQDFKRSVTADNLAKERKAYQDNAQAVADAKRDQVLAVGSHNEQIKQREADLAKAERLYGAQSAQAIRAQTALEQEQKQKQRGSGGTGAGTAQARQAEATGNRLEDIARTSGQKLADIDKSTQDKLLAIDRKAAEERARVAQHLANTLTTSSDDLIASQEADDLDLIGAKKEQMADLQAREQAQAQARIANEKAVQEAKDIAATGDAQLAEDTYNTRQKQIASQEKLDEEYAKKQAELAGDPKAQAALKQQYDEATAAINKAADDRISISKAEADARAAAAADEKARVVAEAEDQKAKVISSAEGQLAGVRKASDAQKATVVANLHAQAQAAERWAADTEAAAARAQDAYNSVTGPTPPPTGGGSNDENTGTAPPPPPAAPTSGAQSAMTGSAALRVSGGMATGFTGGGGIDQAIAIIQEASQIIVIIAQTVRTNKSLLSLLNQYAQILSNATTVLTNIADLRARLAIPQPPLDMAAVQQLANEQAAVVDIIAHSIVPAIFSESKLLEKYKTGGLSAMDILKGVLDLRESVAKTGGPIDPALLGQLAAEAAQVAAIVVSQLVKYADAEVAGLKRYQEATSAAIGILSDVMDLAHSAAEPLPPIPRGTFERLADLAGLATHIILTRLLPTSQSTADALSRYQESVGAAVGVLKDIGDLARGATEPIPPIPVGSFERLADLAGLATYIITHRLLPQSDAQVAALKRYQESSGAAVGVLKGILDFGQAVVQPIPAITPAMMDRLAAIAQQATRIVTSRAIPVTEAQAAALKRYSETQGAAVAVLKNTLDLPAKLFTDYQSPTDAQITRVVKDADRIARQINTAAKAYDTKGLDAARAFSDAIGGTFAAFKDGLLFFQALNSGDFVLDPKNLAKFEAAMGKTIAMAGRLGKLSTAIPPTNIKSLQDTAGALSASYDSMIKLAAVPFGNLPQATGQLGGTTINIAPGAIVINGAGQNTNQIATAVLRQLNQKVSTRRA